MSTLKIEHIANIANSGPDISIDTSGHLNIVNGNLQMGGTTMLDASTTTLKNVSKIGIGIDNPDQPLQVKGVIETQATNSTNGFMMYTYTDNTYRINYNGAGADELILTSGGALGLGNTPGAWSANYPALQIGGGATFTGHRNNTQTQLGQNWWIGTGNQYVVDGAASRLIMNPDSTIIFSQAPSGTAGATMSTINDVLRIDTSGNVMLGTAVPGRAAEGAERFTIADSTHSGMTIRSGTGSYGSINFSDSEGGAGEYAGSIFYAHGALGDKLVLATAGIDRVTIIGNNVGIGTNTIGDKLVVQGAASATASIVIQDPTANDYGTHLSFDDANNKAIFGGLTNGTKNPALSVARDAASGIDIDSSGNVGIGTSSPAAYTRLDVKGRMKVTRDVAAGHASQGNWDFNLSHESASVYGSLYLTPSVSTAEFVVMGGKLRVTHSSGLQIISDTGNATSSDNVAIRYKGTAGGHRSGYLFKDKNDQVNAAIKNNLQDDSGTYASHMELYTSTGGTLARAIDINRFGKVAFDKMPNFATRPYYTNVELGAGAVVDMYPAHVNTGNHFNGTTNRFTAPYAGNYYFAFHSNIWNNTPSVMYFDWYKNGSSIVGTYGGRIYGYYAGGWENMMGFVVLPLASNDYVDLRAQGGGPKVDGGSYGQFIGYALTTP